MQFNTWFRIQAGEIKMICNQLKDKKIKIIECPKWGKYLRKCWEDNFASHLTREEKEKIFLHSEGSACGFLWHIFSYEKRDCLKGEEAEKAFDREAKKECYIFYQFEDAVYIVEHSELLKADDFSDETDVYVVDKDFNWTYVKTHETGWCGPYFSKK